jgi:hypothetical protein
MKLIAIGSRVRIADNIPARVRQICISENDYVEYEVVWWDGNTRHTQWLSAFEVKWDSEEPYEEIGLGFHTCRNIRCSGEP